MGAQGKVLITDDEKFIQKMLTKSLSDEYEIRSAFNGEECLSIATEWQPEIILLDVEMPGQNGYEVCEVLKRTEATQDIPVVFLSSNSSLQERMVGYEVGADDYLIKSSTADELKAKLKKISAYAKEKQDLASSINSAQQTAMEAMSTSFELGKAVRFAERSYTASSYDLLGEYLMDFMRDLKLSAVTMFTCRQGEFYYSSSSTEVAPLEIELMQMLHSGQRFVDFGCRTQVNYPNVTLLIKNMPLEDRPHYGRLKDTFPFVLGTADAKVKMLDAEGIFKQQSEKFSLSIGKTKEILLGLQNNFQNNLNGVSAAVTELVSSMSIELGRMGLDEDQEQFVFSKVEDVSEKLHVCLEENEGIEKNLKTIVSILEHLSKEQNRIIRMVFLPRENEVDIGGDDVELF